MGGFTKKAGSVSGLSGSQSATLSHIEFDSVNNRINFDVAISATENSFLFRDQGKLSSGGKGFVFSNLSTGIDQYPLGIEFFNQFEVGNEGVEGFVYPYVPDCSNVIDIRPRGAPHATDVATYTVTTTSASHHYVFGITFIAEEAVVSTDYLFYSISDTDVNGIVIFSQDRTGLTLNPGDTFIFKFDHPVELEDQQPIYIEISKAATNLGTRTPLNVRASVDDNTAAFVEVRTRNITQKPLSTQEFVADSTGPGEFLLAQIAGASTIHTRNGNTMVTRTGDYFTWERVNL